MGQLLRLLIILFGLWLVIHYVRRALKARRRTRDTEPQTRGSPRMLPCARCGVHVPESQALRSGDKIYCCPEHLKEDAP